MARRSQTVTREYDFDPSLGGTGRYRDRRTGRIVSNETVSNAMETQIDRARENIQTVSRQLADGNINVAEWQATMAQEMKLIHTQAAAVAKGGFNQMTQGDWGAVGNITKQQYEFLENFAKEIVNGDVRLHNLAGEVNGNFLRRADLYAQAGAGTKSQMERRTARQNNLEFERRVLDARAKHCDCCPEQAALGWQPIGRNSLLPLGGCDCSHNCRCVFEFGRQTERGITRV